LLIPRHALVDLADRLAVCPGGVRVASVELDLDPLDLVRAGASSYGSAAFYASPEGFTIGGLGTAWMTATAGPGRLGSIDERLGELPEGLEALVGFAFAADGPTGDEWEDFPCAVALLPQVTARRSAGRSRLTVVLPPGASRRPLLGWLGALDKPDPAKEMRRRDHSVESRPSAEEWRQQVAEAVGAIQAGGPSKVVLARSVQVVLDRPIEGFDLVALLRDRFPGSRVYGWQSGVSTFLGASPELLVARVGRWFQTRPLAGSVGRGTDAREDRRLGDSLLASVKDRAEHGFVVEDVVTRLGPLAETLDRPPAPVVERFAGVQHLATPIVGTTSARLLDLADALHPTAAVAGVPRNQALAHIDKAEAMDRGWYAGGVGWVNADGDGEVAVALRCALVQGERATLYAGNGIVAGSDPQDEVEETRLKLRPLVDLLTAP
jgi:isochorismate synthase